MAKTGDQDENRKTGFAYAAAAALVASVVAFCAIGYVLDRWLGTQPWLLVGGIILGSAAGLFEFVRISAKTY